ncbi:IMS domain-containing protein [Anabaena lutea]|uniref:DUF4101 domain-containing protein n=1 Tax=Anabaena lutea FACHB-196 TaxID=2692881 RepID=A0ABR8FDS4_9NOST|nr:IMS domain-containing protein [Anabaena lutea]MBD2567788.1 DUF4101 domain-containing protein [Anabaena lutea FACHB-196]
MTNSPPSEKKQHTESNFLKDNTFNGSATIRDNTFIGNQTVIQNEPKFVEANLEDFNSKNFPSPNHNIIRNYLETIYKKKLLILGGGADIDKADLARHVAWILKKREEKCPVLEWQRSSDPQSIDVKLQKAEESTIFILTEVSPQNVGCALSKIQKVAASRKHFVLVTTDIPLASWNLSKDIEDCWSEVSSDGLYNSDVLLRVLFQELHKLLEDSYIKNLLEAEPKPQTIMAGNLTFLAVAEQLKTPNIIARFVQRLEKEIENNPIEQEIIETIIDEVTDNQKALNQWYYYILNEREQLLALGLNFFDGLYNDQLFAALEKVVEQVWQKRNPSLRALDYCDLENLHNFFKIDINTEESIIESGSGTQRRMLFKVAWKSHRRQIIAALIAIAELVKDSVANRSFKSELYGNPDRRKLLRRVLGEAISDIGWISPAAVQDTLHQLASDEEIEVQNVAAYAMARWRKPEYKHDQKLFEILHKWQNDQLFISQIKNLLTNKSEAQSHEPQDYIRATIALTVGYAALYDPPNELNSKLYDLLKKLSEDPNNLVRNRFCTHTLPMVVSLHFQQLRDMLREMTHHPDLIQAISFSLARAYRNYPPQVLHTLHSWQQAQPQPGQKVGNTPQPPRENLLATVALAYGEIECDERVHPFTANQAFENLQKILKPEKHPLVRQAVIMAMGSQLRRNFEELKSKLLEVTTEITLKERDEVVSILTDIYLDQRRKLTGGDTEIEIENYYFEVWLETTKRPQTAVEKTILNWVKDDSKPLAQEIATQASISFALALEQAEAELIKQIKEARNSADEKIFSEVSSDPIIRDRLARGLYLDILVPWVVTIKKISYRLSIRNLLPEGLKHHQKSQESMDFVLVKWKQDRDKKISQTSDLLRSGFFWAKNLSWLLALGSGTLLTVVGIAAVNLSKPQPPIISTTPTPGKTSEPIKEIGIALFSDVDVNDKSPNFNTGKLTVKLPTNATPEDRLFIPNQGTNPGEIGINGSNVTYGGTAFGNFSGGDGTTPLLVTFNANSTLEAVQALSRNISYQHTSENSNTGTRAVQIQLTDSSDGKPSNTINKNILVTTKNKEPIVTVPQTQTVKENTILAIKGISISDADSQKLTVTLSVNNGILKIKPNVAKGLTANNIPKNNAKTVILIGSVAQINTILADPAAVIYQGAKDFNGNDSLTVAVNDGGKVGKVATNLVWPPNALEAKTNRSIVNIAVKPINIPPTITVPNTQTVKQNTSSAIKGINITDTDSPKLTVTISVKNGTLTIKPNVPNGLKASNFSNQKNNASVVTFNGTVAQINSTFADPTAITYLSKKDSNSNDTLSITATDGGKKKPSNSVAITIQPINLPPVLSVSEVKTINNGNSTISITKQEAVNLINRYLEAKERIFAPPYNRQLAASLLTGKAYEEKITKPGGGSLEELKAKNGYWIYGTRNVEPLTYFSVTNEQVQIDVKIKEELSYYENGIRLQDTPNNNNYRFTLQPDNGTWKIANIQSTKNLVDSE